MRLPNACFHCGLLSISPVAGFDAHERHRQRRVQRRQEVIEERHREVARIAQQVDDPEIRKQSLQFGDRRVHRRHADRLPASRLARIRRLDRRIEQMRKALLGMRSVGGGAGGAISRSPRPGRAGIPSTPLARAATNSAGASLRSRSHRTSAPRNRARSRPRAAAISISPSCSRNIRHISGRPASGVFA